MPNWLMDGQPLSMLGIWIAACSSRLHRLMLPHGSLAHLSHWPTLLPFRFPACADQPLNLPPSHLCSGDYYLFDEFQTSQVRTATPRKPACSSLYDVFINIRDDEGEHVKTMAACQDMTIMADLEVRRETTRRL